MIKRKLPRIITRRNLFTQYERKHLRQSMAYINRIKRAYEGSITEVLIGIEKIKFNGNVFKVADYPLLKKKIDEVTRALQPKIYTLTVNGIKSSWNLSNEKNNALVDMVTGKKKMSEKVRKIFYDPNYKALDSFTNRQRNGLKLSDRVWRLIEPFKFELEASIGAGIVEGKSAAKMATEMKKHLNEPDRLFRRVRNLEGKLVLSKAAREYHPGQGVYRSSYKNALRLSRTENNMAYRTADHERWKALPFVTGVEVKLSASHKIYDICDNLKGEYPKDFKFVSWHPQCLCYAVPKLMNDKDYDKYEDSILGIADFDPKSVDNVKDVPASFKKYMEANGERIAGWKNTPYFIRDNPNYVKL